jgi:hypothetical protein
LGTILKKFAYSNAVLFLQFTKKIPTETMGSPTMRENVNSSPMKRMPERTPKMGVKNVKALSRLTEYWWINLNQTK